MDSGNANQFEDLSSLIHIIRGVRVMLDADLATIYGYTTKAFNQQVKNNIEKFDDDFRFQLTKNEYEEFLRSKNLTSKLLSTSEKSTIYEKTSSLRSKKLDLKRREKGRPPTPSIRLYRARHLYAYDCVERRIGNRTEQSADSNIQDDERLHYRKQVFDWE